MRSQNPECERAGDQNAHPNERIGKKPAGFLGWQRCEWKLGEFRCVLHILLHAKWQNRDDESPHHSQLKGAVLFIFFEFLQNFLDHDLPFPVRQKRALESVDNDLLKILDCKVIIMMGEFIFPGQISI